MHDPGAGAPPSLLVERERIAQELNRFIIHRLFGIGLKLQALSAGGPDSAISGHLDECVHELDLAISDLRGHIFKLTLEMPGTSAQSTERPWSRRMRTAAKRAVY